MVVGAVVVVLVAAVALFGFALHQNSTDQSFPTASPSQQTQSLAPRIDGIPCVEEMLTYHVHSHLAINVQGKSLTVPANVGIRSASPSSACLYWLHTHDDSGIVHVEAPHVIHPTLGMFFDVWGQPLSRTRVAGATMKPGESMKVWVNGKPFTGNPRSVRLADHETITINIGPPFPPPRGYDFSGL